MRESVAREHGVQQQPCSRSITSNCRISSASASSSSRRPRANTRHNCDSFSKSMMRRRRRLSVSICRKFSSAKAAEKTEAEGPGAEWPKVEESHVKQSAELVRRHQGNAGVRAQAGGR